MGLKAGFTQADFKKMITDGFNNIENAIIFELSFLREQLVNHAREQHTYMDQTGNLTASIGGVIVARGKIHSHFFPDTKLGAEKGQKLAESLGRLTSGFALIIVAGMEYANEVESKGYNVIASAELLSVQEVPKIKARMLAQIQNMR